MAPSHKKSKNPVSSILKKIVDDFFDACADSDAMKGKVVSMMLHKPTFTKKLAEALKHAK